MHLTISDKNKIIQIQTQESTISAINYCRENFTLNMMESIDLINQLLQAEGLPPCIPPPPPSLPQIPITDSINNQIAAKLGKPHSFTSLLTGEPLSARLEKSDIIIVVLQAYMVTKPAATKQIMNAAYGLYIKYSGTPFKLEDYKAEAGRYRAIYDYAASLIYSILHPTQDA